MTNTITANGNIKTDKPEIVDKYTQLGALIVGALLFEDIIPLNTHDAECAQSYTYAIRVIAGVLRNCKPPVFSDDMPILPFEF